MDIGLYFELENDVESDRPMSYVYGFMLELCEEADRLGAGSVWFSEHHRFASGFLPQPLTFCAAAAARTKRIRVGTAVTVAPFRHAAHLAEQATVIDLISDGRFDLGLGSGYRVPEYNLFGLDPNRRYSVTDERAREVRRLLGSGDITPAPAQRRLPIWMGYMGPQGATRAGRLGEGLLSADARNWPYYKQGLVEAGHDIASGRMAGGITAWISDDPDSDWPLVSSHVRRKFDSYRLAAVEGTGRGAPRPVDPDRLRKAPIGGPLTYFVHETPENAAARIAEFTRGAPVEAMHFTAPIAGMPDEMAVRQLHTVCTRLAPLLAGLPNGCDVGAGPSEDGAERPSHDPHLV